MVMPRSRSIGLLSSTWASISRSVSPPHRWMMRSESVDLPWSTWAMMEKLRICCMGAAGGSGAVEVNGRLSHTAGCRPGAGEGPRPHPAAPGACSAARHRHRDELGRTTTPDQQHQGLAGPGTLQMAFQYFDAVHALASDSKDDVSRTQLGLP